MGKRRLTILLLFCCFLLLLCGCKRDSAQQISQNKGAKAYKKVLFIGIDGADPRVMQKLISEGKLPAFKKLAETGAFLPLQTILPAQSPAAWTSIGTGRNPGKHNIFDFIRRKPGSYLPMLSLAYPKRGLLGTVYESYVKAEPFFETTSKHGVPTTVIQFPITFPPSKVKGKLLSGLGVPDIKGLLNSYAYYTSDRSFKAEKGKVVYVTAKDNRIVTKISGPRKKEFGKLKDITLPLVVTLHKSTAKLEVVDSSYPIKEGGWSSWMELKFNAGIGSSVYGIARAFLHSIKPFRMYLTSIQIDPKNPLYPISFPDRYAKELAEEIGLYATISLKEDTSALNEGSLDDASFISQTKGLERERDAMFWSVFKDFKEGLLVFVYDTSDRVSHMFWNNKVLESDSKDPLNLNIHPSIEAYYINKDRFLAKIMKKISKDTFLIIASDHGFTSFERSVNLNRWLVKNGYMKLTREPSKDDPGALFKYTDWKHTKAYSLGFGSIYLNLKEREPEGIVAEREKRAVMQNLAAKLTSLQDPLYRKRAVYKVYIAEDVYSGAQTASGPDMVVGFYPGYRAGWQSAIGGTTKEVFAFNKKHWRGDHIVDPSFVPGVLFTNFKISSESPSQVDIAPTILKLYGITAPDDYDGKALIR